MKTNNARRALCFVPLAALCIAAIPFAACEQSEAATESGGTSAATYVVSIEQSDDGTYNVIYSDGTVTRLTAPAGAEGDDGEDLTVENIYETYVEETGSDMTLAQFIEQYLTITADDMSHIGENLLSSVSIYAEFVETTIIAGGFPGMGGMYLTQSQIVQSGGSGVIYAIDDDSVYIVTNYHVVYDAAADEDRNDGSKIGRSIYCYLYGSENTPVLSGYDENNYYVYDYGDSAIECEYIGGSLEADIAVLRADREDVFAINDGVQAVTLADGYYVGETVYAIGNADANGMTATQGIVSVDSEYISLDIDENGTYESYRSIRFDAAIYHGNSGGGLFNANGELIGITNAGYDDYENMCYAIPVSIVKGTVDNILYYYADGDDSTSGAYVADAGVTLTAESSKYVLNSSGYGSIVEEIHISAVEQNCIAEQAGLAAGDTLKAVIIDGTRYELTRTFQLDELLLTVRPGSTLQFVYGRDGVEGTTSAYTVGWEQLTRAA